MTLNEKIKQVIRSVTVEINGAHYVPVDVVEQLLDIIANFTYETVKPEEPNFEDQKEITGYKIAVRKLQANATQAGITEE